MKSFVGTLTTQSRTSSLHHCKESVNLFGKSHLAIINTYRLIATTIHFKVIYLNLPIIILVWLRPYSYTFISYSIVMHKTWYFQHYLDKTHWRIFSFLWNIHTAVCTSCISNTINLPIHHTPSLRPQPLHLFVNSMQTAVSEQVTEEYKLILLLTTK